MKRGGLRGGVAVAVVAAPEIVDHAPLCHGQAVPRLDQLTQGFGEPALTFGKRVANLPTLPQFNPNDEFANRSPR